MSQASKFKKNVKQIKFEGVWGEIAHYGKIPISVFQEIFNSADIIFISGGGLNTRQ